ncbi:hypothetical protein MUP51_07850 [Candidatus Bathyarchaeota archaeon]|nr:hypothetical protein [Candidatus Bathyarchaeota archaeon]
MTADKNRFLLPNEVNFKEAWMFLKTYGEVYLETDTGKDIKAKAVTTESGEQTENAISFIRDEVEYARLYDGSLSQENKNELELLRKKLDKSIQNILIG